MAGNIDHDVVADFGREWSRFDQAALPEAELQAIFDRYFAIFPWHELAEGAIGFDLGCGSGRWAGLVASRVAELHCIDASAEALEVARARLASLANCRMHLATVDDLPLQQGSMDFGYSLGVLHHLPDTQAALKRCVGTLKPGAPFLVYLYYAFDNRPAWFRAVWKASDLLRRLVSSAPYPLKYFISQAIALLIYLPLARLARMAERAGMNPRSLPLSAYRAASFYTMRTDALDRFGTRLEHRFTRREIEQMMMSSGLERISFSDSEPYWCAVGYRRLPTPNLVFPTARSQTTDA